MILTDRELIKWGNNGGLNPFNKENINPASIDLRMSDMWRDLKRPEIIMRMDEFKVYAPSSLYEYLYGIWDRWWDAFVRKGHPVHRPSTILACTLESVNLDGWHAGEVKLKTTPTRKGLGYLAADWVDPGYSGVLTLTIYVQRDMILRAGQRVCQLVVYRLDNHVMTPYNIIGHYNNQTKPTLAWDEGYEQG